MTKDRWCQLQFHKACANSDSGIWWAELLLKLPCVSVDGRHSSESASVVCLSLSLSTTVSPCSRLLYSSVVFKDSGKDSHAFL